MNYKRENESKRRELGSRANNKSSTKAYVKRAKASNKLGIET